MSELKSFFKPSNIGEIRSKKIIKISDDFDLVDRIIDLNPSIESLELDFDVIKFGLSLKQGDYWDYNHPSTISRAIRARRLPYQLRNIAFKNLGKNPKRKNTVVGLSAKPLRSVDKRIRLFPLYSSFEGAKLFAYSINQAKQNSEGKIAKSRGIIVEDAYNNAPQIAEFGATVRFEVPSRTKHRKPLTFVMSGLPVINNLEKRVIVWGMNFGVALDEHDEPLIGETTIQEYDSITYRKTQRRNTLNQVLFQPHHTAAYIAYAKKQALLGNKIPWKMNPFCWPSNLGAEFYNKLQNNIIVNVEGRRRHLRREEISNLLVRSAVYLGADKILFNNTKRDNPIHTLW